MQLYNVVSSLSRLATSFGSTESYAQGCIRDGTDISLDQFWSLQGTLSEETAPLVLSIIEDDYTCAQVNQFKDAGHSFNFKSISQLAVLAPPLQTFKCVCQAYRINEFPAFPFDISKETGPIFVKQESALGKIMAYIRTFSENLSPFEISVFEAMSNVRNHHMNGKLLRRLTEAQYPFSQAAIDLIIKPGFELVNGRPDYHRDWLLQWLYECVNDVDCLWLEKFVSLGWNLGDRAVVHAVKSGFDSNIQCVLKRQPNDFVKYDEAFTAKYTNADSPYVQIFFRKYVNMFVSEGGGIHFVLVKPALMPILAEKYPNFAKNASCHLTEWAIYGDFETCDQFLKYGDEELDDKIFWPSDFIDSKTIGPLTKYIAHRKQLNSVKDKLGRYSLHYVLDILRETDDLDPAIVQELIDSGAVVNLPSIEVRKPFAPVEYSRTPLQYVISDDPTERQLKAIAILLSAGADTSCITSKTEQNVLARSRSYIPWNV